jgi:hypothetical protein
MVPKRGSKATVRRVVARRPNEDRSSAADAVSNELLFKDRDDQGIFRLWLAVIVGRVPCDAKKRES